MNFTVAFNESVTEHSIITINPHQENSSHSIVGEDSGAPVTYFEDIKEANKSMEGNYKFVASGKYSGDEIYATGETVLYGECSAYAWAHPDSAYRRNWSIIHYRDL